MPLSTVHTLMHVGMMPKSTAHTVMHVGMMPSINCTHSDACWDDAL